MHCCSSSTLNLIRPNVLHVIHQYVPTTGGLILNLEAENVVFLFLGKEFLHNINKSTTCKGNK